MPKGDLSFDPRDYALVSERITLFYARYPAGRILTELVARSEREVTFRASVYRAPDDRMPAATGWASEREGDGDINSVACLENTETSAIGRALANLGFTASRKRPSREEMEKAERARQRVVAPRQDFAPAEHMQPPLRALRESRPVDWELQWRADAIARVLRLLTRAEFLGMRQRRAESFRECVSSGRIDPPTLDRLESRLRGWSERQSRRIFGVQL